MTDSKSVKIRTFSTKYIVGKILKISLLLAFLYIISLKDYLLFHSIAEIIGASIAIAIFLLAWNSRKFADSGFYFFVGSFFLVSGLIMMLHALAYKGMGVIPGTAQNANLGTQLWLANQYILAAGFVAAPFFANRKPKPFASLSAFGVIAAIIFLSIFWWKIFPVAYVDGSGLTAFKDRSEYLVAFLFLLSAYLFFRKKNEFDPKIVKLFYLITILFSVSTIFFTIYVGVYSSLNMWGHLIRLAAMYPVYIGVVEFGLMKPYDFLFGNLKRQEESLKKNERMFRAVVEDQTELICRFFPDGTLTFVNDAYCRYYGKSREALLGKPYFGNVPEDVAEKDKIHLRELDQNNPVGQYEHRAVDKNGWHRWQHWTTRAIFDEKNKVIEFQSVGRDITQQKYTQEALVKSEKNFRNLVDNSLVGIYRADLDGNYLYINEAMAKMFDFDSAGDMIRESAKIRYEKGQDREEFLKQLRKDGRISNYELSGITKTGKRVDILSSAVLTDNRISGMLLDISKKKIAETSLRKSEERYRKLVEMSPEAIFVNKDNKIAYVNQAGADFFGAKNTEDLLGKSIFNLFHKDYHPQMETRIRHLLSGKRLPVVEARCVKLDGTVVFAEVASSLFSDDKGQSIQVMLRDITERKIGQKKIENITRLYGVLYKANEAIVRNNSEEQLFHEICKIIAEDGKFPLVWTGKLAGKAVLPSASAGSALDYLKEIKIETEGPLGQGPTGKCVRENRTVVNDDFDINASTEPWRKAAQHFGFRSSAAIPLRSRNKVVGTLTIYSTEASVFDAEQIKLLEALAADVSYALEVIQKERKRILAEQAILKAKEEWEKTFDSVPDLIAILDPNHKILRANKAMADRLGTNPDKCVGLNCYKCVHNASEPIKNCPHSLTLADEKEHIAEVEEPALGGTFLVSTTPFFGEDGKLAGSVHVARDITERKKAEEKISNLAKFPEENPNIVMRVDKSGKIIYANPTSRGLLAHWKTKVDGKVPQRWDRFIQNVLASGKKAEAFEEFGGKTFSVLIMNIAKADYVNLYGLDITERSKMDKAKDEFISLASHQLRTPLSSIALSTELLLRGVAGDIPSEQKIYMEEVFKATKRMTLLINNLLNVSRVEMGNFKIRFDSLDIFSAVREIVKGLDSLAKEKNLKVEKKLERNVPPIKFDANSFGIIFENILSNAIRYTPKGGTISIELKKVKEGILLKVSDTGCGIPADQKNEIFKKSFRASNAKEVSSEGAGLGLYIAKIAAEQGGAKIWFESKEGKGTTFFVLFPK